MNTLRGPKPWKPYPSQLAVLRAVACGCPLSVAAEVLGLSRTAVASRLSECYERLGVKDPQTLADTDEHHQSIYRRHRAIQICVDRGWWTEEENHG